MGKQTPIKEALGLGEVLPFSDGTQLPCVPASLEDLDDAMQYWETWMKSNIRIQYLYTPENAKLKEAFEELLFIACGRKIPKEQLRKQIRMHDGGSEVMAFLHRFLGFEYGATGIEAK